LDSLKALCAHGANIRDNPILSSAIYGGRTVLFIKGLLEAGAWPVQKDINAAISLKSANGDAIAFLFSKCRTMVPLCSMYVARLNRCRLPMLPKELLRELMYMLFGYVAPRLRP
jgi:hypothetical protein